MSFDFHCGFVYHWYFFSLACRYFHSKTHYNYCFFPGYFVENPVNENLESLAYYFQNLEMVH